MKSSNLFPFVLGAVLGYMVFKYQAAKDKINDLEVKLEGLSEKE